MQLVKGTLFDFSKIVRIRLLRVIQFITKTIHIFWNKGQTDIGQQSDTLNFWHLDREQRESIVTVKNQIKV